MDIGEGVLYNHDVSDGNHRALLRRGFELGRGCEEDQQTSTGGALLGLFPESCCRIPMCFAEQLLWGLQ